MKICCTRSTAIPCWLLLFPAREEERASVAPLREVKRADLTPGFLGTDFPLLNVSKLRGVIARGVNPVLQLFGPQATKWVTLLVLALWSLARDAPGAVVTSRILPGLI